jgi:galactose-1-phosphate uridylyltransferase
LVRELRTVVDVWAQQYVELCASDDITHVPNFENREASTGASNPHPHCQIWAAAILEEVTMRYDRLFDAACPDSMGIHQRPGDGAAHAEWHLHAHFLPPVVRSATVNKFMVGFELLANAQRDLTAEAAAARLRQVAIDAAAITTPARSLE